MKKRRLFFPLFSLLFFCLACKSAPSPEETPVSDLRFDHIEAESIDRVVLYYRLRTGNPRSLPLRLEVRGWKARIDGLEYNRKDAVLTADTAATGETPIEVPPGGSAETLFRLDLNLGACRDIPAPEDSGDYRAELTLSLVYRYGRENTLTGETAALTLFPRIREPEFTITEIAILQAELINTRFRVNLRIDNPNVFPVDLSSFGYELYGAGRFWAEGKETEVLRIPARGSAETRLFLLMNFINMKRDLLDEVIAMRRVPYRFSGEALIGTGLSWLPEFRMRFDRQGRSEVLK
ncbi:MAG: LEA type 2 family protein [Treponema sp.]|jgi:LEA14-like dessication related protein|nr:LEA type 2 family protein [Treponema sp.]